MLRRLSMDGKSSLRYFCWSLLRTIDRCFMNWTTRLDDAYPFHCEHFRSTGKTGWFNTFEHFSSSPNSETLDRIVCIPFSDNKYKPEMERFLSGTSLDKRSRWQKQFSSKNEQPTYVTDTLDTDELIGSGGWELHANPCRWSVSSVPWRSQGCKWRDRVAEDQTSYSTISLI